MDDKPKIMTTTTIKFLDRDLEMSEFDRKNPVVLLMISQIELVELISGHGLLWLRALRSRYGLKFRDNKLHTNIENILLKNNKRGFKNDTES